MYAILRTKKIKNRQELKSACAHNFRTMPVENADENKTKLNKVFVSKNFADVISKMENNFFKHNIEPRSNSVQAVEFVLTASPEFFENKSDDEIKKWANSNYKFIIEKFGQENIISAVEHYDEKTPHIHILMTPITLDGRLSCKDLMGGQQKLSQLQSDYASAMKIFGLKRGKEQSKAKHSTVKEFYALANNFSKLTQNQKQRLQELLSEFNLENKIDLKIDNLLETINRVKKIL